MTVYDSHELPMLRILTDRGTEFCGKVGQHDDQLHLAVNDIGHTKTKTMSPQTNGIREHFQNDLAGVLSGNVSQEAI